MATILVVDDDRLFRQMLRDRLEADHHAILEAATGVEALARVNTTTPDIVLLDLVLPDFNGIEVLRELKSQVPELPVIIITAYGSVQSALDAMKAQASDYLCKPLDLDELRIVVARTLEMAAIAQGYQRLQTVQEQRHQAVRITGESPAARRLRKLVAQVAASEAPSVLVYGESGTGKELVARALHFDGPRRKDPFVEVNCASIPTSLFESELFGHTRGAFTDAKTSKQGLIEVAHQGTLFLDEIGEMAPSLQAKFLRFLEERRVRRVGGTQDTEVNVRVVAATNRNLPRMVESGAFRKDLYYRLNLITIELPLLRDRADDILPLAGVFLAQANRTFRKAVRGFTPEAETLLTLYDWPGNIRELRNVVERIVLLETDEWIQPLHLPPEISGEPASPPVSGPPSLDVLFPQPLAAVQRAYAKAVLARVDGNKTKAAEVLGVTRQTLRGWLADGT